MKLDIENVSRCNFRCTYCMPLDEYEWIDKSELLTYEEITRLARLFVHLGTEKIRLTGGEPLVRKDLAQVEQDYCEQLARSLEDGYGGHGVGGPPDSCAVVSERVARMALRLGSHDNVTVVIVRL